MCVLCTFLVVENERERVKERERDINANVMERVSEGDEKRARTQETRLTDYSCFFALPNSTIDAVFTHTHPPIHAHTRTQRHTHTQTHTQGPSAVLHFSFVSLL